MTAQENLTYTQDAIRRGDYRYAGQMGQEKLRAAQAAVAAENATTGPSTGPSTGTSTGRSITRLVAQTPGLSALTAPPLPPAAPLPTGTVAPIPAKTQTADSRRADATPATPPKPAPVQTAAEIARNAQTSSGRRVTKASLVEVPAVGSLIPGAGQKDAPKKGRRFRDTFGLSGINVPE